MKYGIEGIEKSRVIKSTQILNKKAYGRAIIVNYLDGSQDVFDLNEDNLKKIEQIAEEQGKKFVSKKSKTLGKGKLFLNVSLMVLGIMLVTFVSQMIVSGATTYSIIAGLATLLLGLTSGVSFINIKDKERYIKKYQLYFEQVKDKLNDYQLILEKEKQLLNQRNNEPVKLNSVLDLDSISLSQVESINEKVDRYYKVEKQKVKKLENPSLY